MPIGLDKKVEKIVRKHLTPVSYMYGSKTLYQYNHKDHLVVFNALLYSTKLQRFVWSNDIDITTCLPALKALAKELKDTLYVCYESISVFLGTDNISFDKVKSECILEVSANTYSVGNPDNYREVGGLLKYAPIMSYRVNDTKELLFKHKIFIEDLDKMFFVSRKPTKNPLDKFYLFILKALKQKPSAMKRLDLSSIYVTESFYDEMSTYLKLWLKWSDRYCHPARINSEVGMALLDMGPCTFREAPHWARDNYIYITEDFLKEETKKVKEI